MIYHSKHNKELTWATAAELEAWKVAHPNDIRGQVVFLAPPKEEAT